MGKGAKTKAPGRQPTKTGERDFYIFIVRRGGGNGVERKQTPFLASTLVIFHYAKTLSTATGHCLEMAF